MSKQKIIVELVRNAYERAVIDSREAHAEKKAAEAGAKEWDRYNPDDGVGGFGQNPYNKPWTLNKDKEASNRMNELREAYNFAVDTFIEDDSYKV